MRTQLSRLAGRHGLSPRVDYVTVPDGTRLRVARMPGEGARRGVVLLLTGRTEFIEKNFETCGDLVRSGLEVWTFDWRGQGLSDRSLTDRHKGHITDYRQYLDDLHHIVTAVADLPAAGPRRFMLAHSMGGHIGLRYLHDHPDIFERAVLSAPMVDIRVNSPPVRWLASLFTTIGLGQAYAIGMGPYRALVSHPDDPTAAGRIEDYQALAARYASLTSDPARFRAIEDMIRAQPELAVGGATTAWVHATLRSIARLQGPGYPEAITTPCLIVGGGRDTIVDTGAQAALARRMPHARFLLIERAAHEFLVERDDIRAEFFAALGEHLGLPITLAQNGAARAQVAGAAAS